MNEEEEEEKEEKLEDTEEEEDEEDREEEEGREDEVCLESGREVSGSKILSRVSVTKVGSLGILQTQKCCEK